MIVSDTERVVYNNDYTKQATPYRQAIFLKPKPPRQIEKRPLRTSSPNTSMESIDIRNDNIIEQNLEKRRTGQSIKQTYYRSTRDRTKDRTIDTGRTFDTVGSSIFDTTNNEVEMDIQHAKPIEKERKKYYRNIKEKETAQTQPSKSSYRPITDSKKYKDSISECYDSESSITLKEKKHKYRTVIYREKIKYVKDVGIQCNPYKDVETQTDLTYPLYGISGTEAVKELLHFIGESTLVENGKPSYQCKSIAEKLTNLTGISTDAKWVYYAFKH